MPQTAHEFHFTRKESIRLPYLLHLPADYDDSQSWPLILFLHGSGERGTDADLVRKYGLPKCIERGDDLPFIVLSPQCPADSWWPDYHEAVMSLLDAVIDAHSVDHKRVYLTGLSMGGMGTWFLAQRYPARFAAIAPICGGLPWYVDMDAAAERMKAIPTWAFHGEQDDEVPIQESRMMVDALGVHGADVTFTSYPELGHNSWSVTYDNAELYRWFLSHRKE